MKKLRDALERAKNQIENCFPVIDPEADGCTDPFEWAEIISVRVRSITANLDEALSALAELEKPGEDALYKNLYQAARSCILNKYPYEDESGIIKLQLGNYAKLKLAYDTINKALPEPPHAI